MSGCAEFEDLKAELIHVASRRKEMKLNGSLTAALDEQLRRQLLEALLKLVEHHSTHGCVQKAHAAHA